MYIVLALALPIIHRQHNDRTRPRQHLLRISAALLISRHPRHLARAAFGQPLAKFLSVRRRDASGDTAEIEAEAVGQCDEIGFHGATCHEKARRASAIKISAASE